MVKGVPQGSSDVRRFAAGALHRRDSLAEAHRPGGRGTERSPYTSLSIVGLCGISRVPSLDRGGW
jgi:hypothetical protein